MAIARQLSNGDFYWPAEFAPGEVWWRGLWLSLNMNVSCGNEDPNAIVTCGMNGVFKFEDSLSLTSGFYPYPSSSGKTFTCNSQGVYNGTLQLFASHPLTFESENWMVGTVGQWDSTTYEPLNQTAIDRQAAAGGLTSYVNADEGINTTHCFVFGLTFDIAVNRSSLAGGQDPAFVYRFYKKCIIDLEQNIDDGPARILSASGLEIDLSIGATTQDFGSLDIQLDQAVVPYNKTTEREVIHLDNRLKSTE